MDALSNWTADEILLEHSRSVTFLLHKLQGVLADGALRATGFLALFYTAVLFTEGIGVYMQQRWAELLMIFATAGLIPIEVRNLWHRPDLIGAALQVVEGEPGRVPPPDLGHAQGGVDAHAVQ